MSAIRGCLSPSVPSGRQRSALRHQHSGRRISQLSAIGRRDLLLGALLPGLLDEATPPPGGSCPTCIGVVDGTLGSCAGLTSCVSSFDDTPRHFVAPWTYDNTSISRGMAVRELEAAARSLGGTVRQAVDGEEYGYVYVTFDSGPWLGTDDVEFLLPQGDTTVVLRSSARLQGLTDLGRNERRLEQLRLELGWEQVPILRNRKRALIIVESPWDTFGPVPFFYPDYSWVERPDEE